MRDIVSYKYNLINHDQNIKNMEKMVQTISKCKSVLPEGNSCANKCSEEVRKYRDICIALSKIDTGNYEDRHKKEINQQLGMNYYLEERIMKEDTNEFDRIEYKANSNILIKDLISLDIGNKLKLLAEVDIKSRKENDINIVLDKMKDRWNQEGKFSTSDKLEIKTDEIFDEFDNSLAELSDIQSNKYGIFFSKSTEEWNKNLIYFQDLIISLIQCFRSYKYMENIFGAKDIREKLKTETELFKKVQADYKEIVNNLRLTMKGNAYEYMFNVPNKRDHLIVKEMIYNLDRIKKEVEK